MVRFCFNTQVIMLFKARFVFFVFIILLHWSCKERTEVPTVQVFSNLEIGQKRVYQIIQETEVLGKRSIEFFFIQEIVTDSLRFNNDKYFRKEVFRSNKADGPWQFQEYIFENRNEQGIFLESETFHLLKIALPAKFSTTWKVNQRLETLNGNQGKYLDFRAPYNVGSEMYSDGLKVQIEKDSTGVHNFENIEVYSLKYGLISSTRRVVYYCESSPSCLGKGIVESFLLINKKLIGPILK